MPIFVEKSPGHNGDANRLMQLMLKELDEKTRRGTDWPGIKSLTISTKVTSPEGETVDFELTYING